MTERPDVVDHVAGPAVRIAGLAHKLLAHLRAAGDAAVAVASAGVAIAGAVPTARIGDGRGQHRGGERQAKQRSTHQRWPPLQSSSQMMTPGQPAIRKASRKCMFDPPEEAEQGSAVRSAKKGLDIYMSSDKTYWI